ncbi:hypothetical protein ACWDSD_11205 [Streptomyces spiralis]
MHTTTPAATTAAPAPRRPFLYGYRTVTLIGMAIVALLAFGAVACQSLEGGPVRSAAAYRERVAETRRAGERALGDLNPVPTQAGTADEVGSTSCVDDFGFDDAGVTRDEPTYKWELEFPSRAAYNSAVDDLRRTWTARGLKVIDLPAQPRGEPGAGLHGIRTSDEQDIQLSFAPDYFTGRPTIQADGGCIRHETAPEDYDDENDETF